MAFQKITIERGGTRGTQGTTFPRGTWFTSRWENEYYLYYKLPSDGIGDKYPYVRFSADGSIARLTGDAYFVDPVVVEPQITVKY